MNSTKLLNEVAELSSQLGELDADIGELKSLLRAFTADVDSEDAVPLPSEFDYEIASAKLTELLKARHKTNAALAEASAKYDAARQVESQKALASCQKRYREAVVRLLQSAVALASAVRDAEGIRDEARSIAGGLIGPLPHIGPMQGGWDLTDYSSFIGHWLREAKHHGFIDGTEKWLAGITF